jgi:hypothetical protein
MKSDFGAGSLTFVMAGLLFATGVLSSQAMAASIPEAIGILQKVENGAKGAAEARTAVKSLAAEGEKAILPVLKSFQGASPLAINWLRTAFEQAAENHLKTGGKLSESDLLPFVRDTTQSPVARRMAYEWLQQQRPDLKAELIPTMVLDPAPDFRRDAVEMLISDAASATDKEKATELYQQAMKGAVHEDQVKSVAEALRERGVTVDIRKHLGFLSAWKVIGPFDNKEEKGYAVAYPPEEKLDLDAEYAGQLGPVQWKPLETEDDFGKIDIAKQIENHKGSLMYLTTTFTSASDGPVELRLGTPNAWKLWVNGELAFQREEYHRSSQMDQYRIPVQMKTGPNTILLKVCQNEQTQDWAQKYEFQLRVCDTTGVGLTSVSSASAARTVKGAN